MQKQLQLSGTGNNHLELAKTIKQHPHQNRSQEINLEVRPEHTTTVYNRKEASIIKEQISQARTQETNDSLGQNLLLPSRTGQKHQIPYKTINSHI